MPVHVDEYGTSFSATLVTRTTRGLERFKLTGADVTFEFHKPDGTVVERAATITNTAKGEAQYIAPEDFLDTPGVWEWQPKVENADGRWYGPREQFNVDTPLSPTA